MSEFDCIKTVPGRQQFAVAKVIGDLRRQVQAAKNDAQFANQYGNAMAMRVHNDACKAAGRPLTWDEWDSMEASIMGDYALGQPKNPPPEKPATFRELIPASVVIEALYTVPEPDGYVRAYLFNKPYYPANGKDLTWAGMSFNLLTPVRLDADQDCAFQGWVNLSALTDEEFNYLCLQLETIGAKGSSSWMRNQKTAGLIPARPADTLPIAWASSGPVPIP